MKRYHLWLSALLFILLLLLSACTRPAMTPSSDLVDTVDPPTAPPPSPTATNVPVETKPPTETPPPLPSSTPTPEPSATPKPSATPTATATYPPPPQAVHVPILMYHYVSDLPADADRYRRDLTVTPGRFEAQLRYLKEHGYQTITLSDIYETLTSGKPLPAHPIVLTFDDGYRNAYTEVLPRLQDYGFVAVFFVLATPAHYEAPQYLTWDQIHAMSDAGMSMQAHGRDHKDLTNRSYEFLVYQILGAKEAVEAHTGKPVHFFCYPSGRYNDDVAAVVASAGYWGAVTTAWGTELRLDNRYAWPRIRVRGAWDLAQFAATLESLNQSN